MSNVYEMTAEEKLRKARVHLNKEKPFFGFLTMHLELNEVDEKNCPTMAVDDFGNLYYNPKFVNKLSDAEIKGALAHEVMHCALEHLQRGKGKVHDLFNISSDIVINSILTTDGLTVPKNALIPHNNEFSIFGIKLQKINDKTSEEVYDKIWRKLSKKFQRQIAKMKKFIKDQQAKGVKGFDGHRYNKDGQSKTKKCDACGGSGQSQKKCGKCGGSGQTKDGKPCQDCAGTGKQPCEKCGGKGTLSKKRIDWKTTMIDACNHAKQRGNLPAGMERIVGKLMETHIDWRGLLYRYITNQIPVDYTWARPSRRSHSLGVYLPDVEKEMIEVMVAVDTSGSISQHELAEFISEISSICRSFKNVDLTVIDCDCRVNGVHTLRNASPGEVIDKIGKRLKGGGGTSHVPVFNWINKNKPQTKFTIAFTDGYTEFPPKSQVKQPVLWVVAGNWRASKDQFPYGNVIELPKDN